MPEKKQQAGQHWWTDSSLLAAGLHVEGAQQGCASDPPVKAWSKPRAQPSQQAAPVALELADRALSSLAAAPARSRPQRAGGQHRGQCVACSARPAAHAPLSAPLHRRGAPFASPRVPEAPSKLLPLLQGFHASPKAAQIGAEPAFPDLRTHRLGSNGVPRQDADAAPGRAPGRLQRAGWQTAASAARPRPALAHAPRSTAHWHRRASRRSPAPASAAARSRSPRRRSAAVGSARCVASGAPPHGARGRCIPPCGPGLLPPPPDRPLHSLAKPLLVSAAQSAGAESSRRQVLQLAAVPVLGSVLAPAAALAADKKSTKREWARGRPAAAAAHCDRCHK